MKTFRQFREAKEKTAVVTFGRMNPPTIGHQKLVDNVLRVARQNSADPFVFLSHTQKKDKDPLDYKTKIAIAGKAFGKVVKKDDVNNPFDVVYKMRDEGYTHVFFVAGSDRVPQYNAMFKKYSGHPDPEKDIGVELQVVSAGERDPDSDSAEGMSASKMRAAAVQSDFNSFRAGMPRTISDRDCRELMDKIRDIMLN